MLDLALIIRTRILISNICNHLLVFRKKSLYQKWNVAFTSTLVFWNVRSFCTIEEVKKELCSYIFCYSYLFYTLLFRIYGKLKAVANKLLSKILDYPNCLTTYSYPDLSR